MKPDIAVFYVPCSDFEEARHIGSDLLDEGFIACANIIPSITSLYVWQGKKEESNEAVLILKTDRSRRDSLREEIARRHSYSCPCILEIEPASLNQGYEDWLLDSLKDKKKKP